MQRPKTEDHQRPKTTRDQRPPETKDLRRHASIETHRTDIRGSRGRWSDRPDAFVNRLAAVARAESGWLSRILQRASDMAGATDEEVEDRSGPRLCHTRSRRQPHLHVLASGR